MQEIISFLKSVEGKTLLLTHKNADVDAISSCVALKKYLDSRGVEVKIGTSESVSRQARKLVDDVLIDPDCSDFENVIAVETSTPELLSTVKNLRADAVIDHHAAGRLAENAKVVHIDEGAKSAAQIVYMMLSGMGFEFDSKTLEIIACGIVADTAFLKIAGVKEFEILVEILKTGVKYQDVLDKLKFERDQSEIIASLRAASRMELYRVGELVVAFSKVVSFEAAACRAILRMGADIAVVAAIKKDEIRISSRGSRRILEKGLDLSEIFKKVGSVISGSGGGHDMAGSANGKDRKAWDAAKKLVLKEIRSKVGGDWRKLD